MNDAPTWKPAVRGVKYEMWLPSLVESTRATVLVDTVLGLVTQSVISKQADAGSGSPRSEIARGHRKAGASSIVPKRISPSPKYASMLSMSSFPESTAAELASSWTLVLILSHCRYRADSEFHRRLIKSDTLAGVRGCGSIELCVSSSFSPTPISCLVSPFSTSDFDPAMAGADTAIRPAATKAVVSDAFHFFLQKNYRSGLFYFTENPGSGMYVVFPRFDWAVMFLI